MKSSDLIKELEVDGWMLDRIKGSHHHFRHQQKPGTVTAPHPKGPRGRAHKEDQKRRRLL